MPIGTVGFTQRARRRKRKAVHVGISLAVDGLHCGFYGVPCVISDGANDTENRRIRILLPDKVNKFHIRSLERFRIHRTGKIVGAEINDYRIRYVLTEIPIGSGGGANGALINLRHQQGGTAAQILMQSHARPADNGRFGIEAFGRQRAIG